VDAQGAAARAGAVELDRRPRPAAGSGRGASPRLRVLLALVALLGSAALAIAPTRTAILRTAGRTLVVEDVLAPADVIVVSTGADGAGVLEAVDLVRAGVASRVAVFSDPPDPVVDREFLRRGVPYEDAAARAIRQLRALGVEGVEQIPRVVAGSEDEALAIPEWSRPLRLRSVLLVTTADHTRRLRRMLRRSMKGHETRVTVRAARFSPFDPEAWWQTREGARTGVIELQKLILDVALHPLS